MAATHTSQEDFVIKPAEGYCALESVVGPFQFVISGSIREWRPAAGELEFQFTAVDILLLGNKVCLPLSRVRGV